MGGWLSIIGFLKTSKDYFFHFLSFGSPQAIAFNLSSILLSFGILPVKSSEHTIFKCVFKNVIFPFIFRGNCPETGLFAHCNCPGCGMTRALSNLLHGNFSEAWHFNRLVYPLVAVMLVLIAINMRKTYFYWKDNGTIIPMIKR